MKKFILSIMMCAFVVFVFGQRQIMHKDKNYYLEESKIAKQTAWVLLGAGTAVMVIGAVGFSETFSLEGSGENNGYGFLFLAGSISDVVSIPYFIKASNYRNLAGELSLGPEKWHLVGCSSFAYQTIPAIKWRFRF
jgi:hypothetical protein